MGGYEMIKSGWYYNPETDEIFQISSIYISFSGNKVRDLTSIIDQNAKCEVTVILSCQEIENMLKYECPYCIGLV